MLSVGSDDAGKQPRGELGRQPPEERRTEQKTDHHLGDDRRLPQFCEQWCGKATHREDDGNLEEQ